MNSSTFGSFEIGRRALHAQQMGAHVTGQNIANANTEGYSRQMVHMKALVPPAVPGVVTPPGYGVAVSDIVRIKSEFYDDQLRKALTAQHYWEARGDTLTAIEVTFQEPGEQSLNTYLSEFFDAWQDVSVNPESHAARISLREQASTLTTIVGDIYQRLTDYSFDVQKELEVNIEQINSLAKEITELNDSIVRFNALGKKSNELLDERDLRLQELSELIDIRVIEKTNGALEVMAGGRILLHDDRHFPLEIGENPDTGDRELVNSLGHRLNPQGGKMLGLLESYNEVLPKYMGYLDELVYSVVMEVNALHREGYGLNGSTGINFFEPWTDPLPGDIIIDPESLTDGEGITGFNMSDIPAEKLFSGEYSIETYADYTQGARLLQDEPGNDFIPTYSQNNRTLVEAVNIQGGENLNSSIMFEVTKINDNEVYVNYEYRHMDRSGETEYITGVKRFTAGEENTFSIDESDLQFTFDLAGAGDLVEGDKFVINTMASGEGNGYGAMTLKDDAENEIFGVVLEEEQFLGTKEFSFFQLDPESGEQREVTFSVTFATLEDDEYDLLPYEPFDPEDREAFFEYLRENQVAANFRLSDAVLEDLNNIAASTRWVDDEDPESGNGHNALNIAQLREKGVLRDGSASFHEYLRGFIADLGVEGRESERMARAMDNVALEMKKEQDAVASVSLDDEMLNLIQFQHAYNAAAKFLSTFDQMLEILLTQVGR